MRKKCQFLVDLQSQELCTLILWQDYFGSVFTTLEVPWKIHTGVNYQIASRTPCFRNCSRVGVVNLFLLDSSSKEVSFPDFKQHCATFYKFHLFGFFQLPNNNTWVAFSKLLQIAVERNSFVTVFADNLTTEKNCQAKFCGFL